MPRLVMAYLAALVSFGALDFIWLSQVGPRLYKPALGDLLTDSPRLGPAVAFYGLYLAGIVFFAVRPALAASSWRVALIQGAVLGLVAYATYDLTNQATLRVWPIKITIMDLAWGVFATAVAATVSFCVTTWASRATH